MGTLISGEGWLLELADRGEPYRAVAGRLIRMQILTHIRSGHLLVLGYEYTRRAITHSARCGSLASVMVECQGCHCQAKLSDWERASRMAPRGRMEALRARTAQHRDPGALFLATCPGSAYAEDALASIRLPRR